jgi:N-acetylmuramoyl-L-alanine amidase
MYRYLAVIALSLWFFLRSATASEWQIYRAEGRDYVSLENVAQFYGLTGNATPVANHAELTAPNSEIGVQVGSREIVINGVKQWLSFPVVLQDGKALISRLDLAKTVEPMLRPQRIQNLQPVQTVVLDPGHGGHDTGATNPLGKEKDYALDVCLRIKPLLEARGLKVVLTRDHDIFIPLEQRPKVANAIPNSIFVAVHFNCGETNSPASGFEVFSITPRGAPSTADNHVTTRDYREEPGNSVDVPSSALAASVYHAILGRIPQVDRGIKHARFAVIRLATVPSILVEGGFISNPSESQLINTAEWRQRLAESITTGIVGFKNLSELHQPPTLVADYRKQEASPSPAPVAGPGPLEPPATPQTN